MDFHSKITISNYSDIRSVYHSNYSNTKFHIRFSSNIYMAVLMAEDKSKYNEKNTILYETDAGNWQSIT